MSYQQINRAGVDHAEPLEFATAPRRGAQPEKQANISIEIAPDGLHVRCEYTGTLASIPEAIERLRAAGVLDLVRPLPIAQPRQKKARIEPVYDGAGDPCCPVHTRPLKEGQYGLFCSAKAKPGEEADIKGYCGLKFS